MPREKTLLITQKRLHLLIFYENDLSTCLFYLYTRRSSVLPSQANLWAERRHQTRAGFPSNDTAATSLTKNERHCFLLLFRRHTNREKKTPVDKITLFQK